jgi:hypothetical protein
MINFHAEITMNADEIAAWYFAGRQRLLSDDRAIEAFHHFGSRCRFLKTLPPGSAVLDVGAGEGALPVYRQWPAPSRDDLRIFAYAADAGEHFDQYDGVEIGFWPQQPPHFPGISFDAIMACNFIEHIEAAEQFVRWACGRLSASGRLYLEWPHQQSIDLPTTAELRARGIEVMVGNYHDDGTHCAVLPELEFSLRRALAASSMTMETWGIASVPTIDAEMLCASKAQKDIVGVTLAYWSFTGWCQYLVARKASRHHE